VSYRGRSDFARSTHPFARLLRRGSRPHESQHALVIRHNRVDNLDLFAQRRNLQCLEDDVAADAQRGRIAQATWYCAWAPARSMRRSCAAEEIQVITDLHASRIRRKGREVLRLRTEDRRANSSALREVAASTCGNSAPRTTPIRSRALADALRAGERLIVRQGEFHQAVEFFRPKQSPPVIRGVSPGPLSGCDRARRRGWPS